MKMKNHVEKMILTDILILAFFFVGCNPKMANFKPANNLSEKVKIDGLFYLNNESLPIWLVPQATGMWAISFETAKDGTHAEVKMEDGSTTNLSFSESSGKYSLKVKTEDNSTFTVRKLPDSSISLVLLSKQLFAGRFKLAVIMRGPNNLEMFFLEIE